MTRDSFIWWIGMIAAIAGGLAVLDTKTATESFGIPAAILPYLRLLSLLVGIVSGYLKMSPLKLSDNKQAELRVQANLPPAALTDPAKAPRVVPLVLLACLLGGLVVGPTAACATAPPTVTTPQAQLAYRLEDAVDALNTLQHEAIVLNRGGTLSDATTRRVGRYARTARRSIDAAIDQGTGCAQAIAAATAGLTQLETDLGADRASLAAALGTARRVLTALGGTACRS